MTHLDLDSTDLNWLAGLARALVRQDADDLVQDAVALALDGRVPEGVPLRAWLGGVVRRLALQRHRGEGRRKRREAEVAAGEALPETSDLVARAEVAERVAAVARGLEEPLRRTVLLHFMEGCTVAEIARWRLRKGLARMREELAREGVGEGTAGDWSACSAALLPLTRMHRRAGAPTVGAAGLVGGAVGGTVVMKWIGVGAAALGLTWLGWSFVEREAEAPAGEGGAGPSQTVELAEGSRSVALEKASEVVAEEVDRRAPTAPEPAAAEAFEGWRGRVVDRAGLPVPGAWVRLVDGDAERRATSDAEGAFELAAAGGEGEADLGVVANGFLRRVVEGVEVGAAELVVELDRGERLTGRVVDTEGRGVAGLALLAHGDGASIRHVSPSQMAMSAEAALVSSADSGYEQCRARSGAGGAVQFSGLAPGRVEVHALEAGWRIVPEATVQAGESFVVWTVERALGVEVMGVAAGGGDVGQVNATFLVDLEFEDGGRSDALGQWVGRGQGRVQFVLSQAELPPELRDRRIVRARFFGTARRGGDGILEQERIEWSAEPMVDSSGVTGVALARVELPEPEFTFGLDPEEGEATNAEPVPTVRLELEARYDDATPFVGPLHVDWIAQPEVGTLSVAQGSAPPRWSGDGRARRLGPGRYSVEVPRGEVGLEVSDGRASGSLAAWRGKVDTSEGAPGTVRVTLERGAQVELMRPDGFEGDWSVHASRQFEEGGEWLGSWGYGTGEESLVLAALEPARWRFRFSQTGDFEDAEAERIIELEAGDDVRVTASD